MRVKVTLACTDCKQRNYNTMKNKKNDPDRIEFMKYCKFCKKHTLHRETKQLIKGCEKMDRKSAVSNAKKRPSIREYFKGVKVETGKVIWPNKKELASFTSVVIVTCFVFAIIFWVFDTAFLALLKAVLNISMQRDR